MQRRSTRPHRASAHPVLSGTSARRRFRSYGGLTGVMAGFTVAFKQLTPDAGPSLPVIGTLQCSRVPFLLAVGILVPALLGLVPVVHVIFVWSGIVAAWLYLRYYQPHGTGQRGDASDLFALTTFLPESLRYAVRVRPAAAHHS